jgi:hypothetical protein
MLYVENILCPAKDQHNVCIVFLYVVIFYLVNNVHLAKESFELSEFIPAFSVVVIKITSITGMQ